MGLPYHKYMDICSNLNHMCLIAYFMDSDWKIHKRILSFYLVENHKGETLGKAVEMRLLD